jgi:hypothetical protein
LTVLLRYMKKVVISGVLSIISSISFVSAYTASFSQPSYTVSEGKKLYVGFRLGDIDSQTIVKLRLIEGSAQSGEDYKDVGIVTIPYSAGKDEEKGFAIETIADSLSEGAETLTVSVASINNIAPAKQISAKITIEDSGTEVDSVTTKSSRTTKSQPFVPKSTTLDCPAYPSWGSRIKVPYLYYSQTYSTYQIDKPILVAVRGITADADITTDDTEVEFGPKVRVGGAAGSFAFDQKMTVRGEPREVTLRVSAGGLDQAVCDTAKIQRKEVAYTTGLSVDKTVVAPGEQFMMTVTGLPANTLVDGGIGFYRNNAKTDSCEYRGRSVNGMGVSWCNGAPSVTCMHLPAYGALFQTPKADSTGKIEYICSTNVQYSGLGIQGDTQYTALYTARAALDSFKLEKEVSFTVSQSRSAPLTSYGSCSEGKGIDPTRVSEGCKNCEYIPDGARGSIATCKGAARDVYVWVAQARNLGATPRTCTTIPPVGEKCDINTASICMSNNTVYNCIKQVDETNKNVKFYGKVLEGTKPLAGVSVEMALWTGMERYVWKATTDATGGYLIQGDGSDFCAWNHCNITFTKDGYQGGYLTAKAGEQNAVKLVKKATVPTSIISANLSLDKNSITVDPKLKNTVVVTLSNAQAGDVETCLEILSNPANPSSENPAFCGNTSNFYNFEGNDEWKFVGQSMVGTFDYDAGWMVPGFQAKVFFRKKSNPSNVVFTTLRVMDNAPETPASSSNGKTIPGQPVTSATTTPIGGGGSQGGGSDYWYGGGTQDSGFNNWGSNFKDWFSDFIEDFTIASKRSTR